jgi:hypothetical protein
MSHSAAFHALFAVKDKSEYMERYNRNYTFKKHDLRELAKLHNSESGLLHNIVNVVIVAG